MNINENLPESAPVKSAEQIAAEEKNGQMLVIYLPEGSVIVDRTDVDHSRIPHTIIEKTITTPPVESRAEEPIPAAQPAQGLHPTLQEVVQLAVQEVMQNNKQSPAVSPVTEGQEFARPIPRRRRTLHRRNRRRRINWVHAMNLSLISYIILVAVLPAIFSTFFGVAVYASKVSHPRVSIAAGDLMICKILPAFSVKSNDVVLVRDGITWRLDARQVTSIASGTSETTFNTASTSGAAISNTYVMSNTARVFKVSSVMPGLGYATIFLGSTLVKVTGALFLLFLNLRMQLRRARRFRRERATRKFA